MSAANKTILRRFYEELFNQGHLSVADEIVAENYVDHNPAPGEQPGREGLKGFVTYLRAGFPDIHFSVDDQLAEGDKVFTRWTATGAHQGEFAGVPATGKPVNVAGMSVYRVGNGQIQEGWNNWDALGMMQQLGVIPASDAA